MRKINFEFGPSVPNIDQTEHAQLKKDFHDQLRLWSVEGATVEELKFGDQTFLTVAADADKVSIEKTREFAGSVAEIIKQIYPILIKELRKSRVHLNEDELREHFLSKDDFLSRVVINFDPGAYLDKSALGAYEVVKHRVNINYWRFVTPENKIKIKSLINTVVHEFLHFASFNEAVVNVTGDDADAIVNAFGKTSGYSNRELRKPDKFCGFNEGVTELYALEISQKIDNDVVDDLDKNNLDYSPYDQAGFFYEPEMASVKKIVECMAAYAGVSYETVWQGLKRGYFEGGVLSNPEVIAALVDCFGDDFVDNFLVDFRENNRKFKSNKKGPDLYGEYNNARTPADNKAYNKAEAAYRKDSMLESIGKRWQYFGAKKIRKGGLWSWLRLK